MALSRQKAGSLLGPVLTTLQLEENRFMPHERLPALTAVIRQIAQHFYPVLWQLYLEPQVMSPARSGKFSSGSGTWTALTRTLEITFSYGLTINDVEKFVTFWTDEYAYGGFVESVVSSTKCVVRSIGLPEVNDTVLGATILGGGPSVGAVVLTSLPVMWGQGNMHIDLESSATEYVEALSLSELKTWSPTAFGNTKKIVWTITGQLLPFRLGSDLTSPGTLVVRYPRLPHELLSYSQDIDLPDGVYHELAKQLLMQRLAPRIPDKRLDFRAEIQSTIGQIWSMFGESKNAKELKLEVDALT